MREQLKLERQQRRLPAQLQSAGTYVTPSPQSPLDFTEMLPSALRVHRNGLTPGDDTNPLNANRDCALAAKRHLHAHQIFPRSQAHGSRSSGFGRQDRREGSEAKFASCDDSFWCKGPVFAPACIGRVSSFVFLLPMLFMCALPLPLSLESVDIVHASALARDSAARWH
jgi:hypothetical protein